MSAETNKNATITVITFSIGPQKLAIPATDLREIMDPLPMTRVPGAGKFAPWVLNVRGQVLPLADLRLPLGITDKGPADRPEDARRFLVLELLLAGEPATVAIMSDIVHEVAMIPKSSIEPLPSNSMWPADFVTGLFKGDDESFVLMPDLSTICTAMAQRAAAAA